MANWPAELDERLRRKLLSSMVQAFDVSEAEIFFRLSGESPPPVVRVSVDPEAELREVLPRGGWFEWYDKFTAKTESPLSYHIFASLVVLGCCLGRKVWMNMGFFRVWPNYNVVLIGPTGKVRKTSATDISTSFIRRAVLCPIMADKLTPEALASALVESGHHYVYAPEFSVLFGKQKYNEGLTTLIIRLLDCPDEWVVRTQARGPETVTNLAINILGCSTISLLSTSTPQEVTSSGFLNRFMLVVEDDTTREFETPIKGPESLEGKLFDTLKFMRGLEGEVGISEWGAKWRRDWYHQRWKMLRQLDNEMAAEIIQRGDMHMRRTAMLIHLAQCGTMTICEDCVKAAAGLIAYTERRIPAMAQALHQTNGGSDLDFVFNSLAKLGGAADHSTLLRKVSIRLSAGKMKSAIRTLEEAGRVKSSKQGGAHFYRIMED